MTTRYVRSALRLLVLAGLALTATAASAQTGKLSGRVLDANGEPLISATVLVVGTTYGAATDLDGVYNILRIPPGTVSVRVSSIGYQTQVIEGVQVQSNTTTELNVTLQDEIVAGEEVIVTAEQPVVDITQTSTIATVSRDEIAALPVQELADVVNLQAGVVDGHFRGGRLGEVQFQVDGVSVNNPYDNTSTLTLDRSVLQEVQVISGTFDAEYGQALSGVVNAVLRSGDANRYEASFEFFGGDYLSPGNDSTEVRTSIGGRDSVATVPFAPYISDIDPLARQNFQGSISGPFPFVPGTTFLLNGQRFVNNGRFAAERRFLPTDSSDFERNVFNPTGDGAVVPLGYDRRWSFLGKVSNSLIPNVRLDYQFIGAVRDRQGADYNYRFNPDGASTQDEFSLVHGLGVLHTLSNNVFYELNLRQNLFDYSDYRFEDLGTLPETGTRVPLPSDSPYAQAGRAIGSQNFENGAIVQGYDLGRFVQRTNSYVAKGAVTAQVTNVHLVKAGFEIQTSDVEFGQPGAVQALIIDGRQQLGVLRDTLGAQVIDFQPVQGAAFIQDRIEWGDLRVRAGLRMEYFDANATVPSDPQNPANAIPDAPESRPVDTSAKVVLAPRLGVSFPFLDRASLFFSYGHFYQLPGLGTFFNNADYTVLQDLQQGNEFSQGVLGNPDLDPEFTTQYEFGFKSRVTRDLGLDVSLFYKDIRDLLGIEFIQTYTAASYARWTNVDFGNVRGFTISVDQRAVGSLSTTLDYSFQIASGNASDPRDTFNRAASGDDPLPRVSPFDWDQRHTLNATAILSEPDNYNVTGILRMGSGRPYTPSLGTGFGANLENNSGRKDLSVVVDLRAEKALTFAGLSSTAFVRVFNVFDSYYQNGAVYSDTGSPFYTLNPERQLNPDPRRFAEPRRIEVGISLGGSRPVRR
ncbi:TonB-dependent receptor [Rubrivirga sp.]|uniref:TonB-dependent receptor n=1 Tax=Rubrivirga sp. TaxID=1885344 RepID=UPI003B51FC3B